MHSYFVLEEAEARRIAEGLLAEREVLIDVAENRIGWTYYWNSVAYVETGDDLQGIIGNAPIVIDRKDGSIVPTGTGESVEYYIRRYEHRGAWLRTASTSDQIVTDALNLMTIGQVGLPGITSREFDRLAAIHPASSEADIQTALGQANAIGKRV